MSAEIQAINHEALRRLNVEVSLRANQFANTLLSGVFRALFKIERSFEFAEPEVFQFDDDPDRILWSRLNQHWMRHLPLALAEEEVLAARFQLFTEYDFVLIADISQSMMLDWWPYYGGQVIGEEISPMPPFRVPGDRTKLFLLKYIIVSFLRAAQVNDFSSFLCLFGGGTVKFSDSKEEPNFEGSVLARIDQHYARLASFQGVENPTILRALRQVAVRQRRSIVLCISDFLDTIVRPKQTHPALSMTEVVRALSEIRGKHRLVVLQVNDLREIEPRIESMQVNCKNCPFMDGELRPRSELDKVGENRMRDYVAESKRWSHRLRSMFAGAGILTEHVLAGRDDAEVDRKLIRLAAMAGE